MGENYVSIMEHYFDVFKEKMNNRFKIPKKLVEDYKDDVCFMVDSDRVYIHYTADFHASVIPFS